MKKNKRINWKNKFKELEDTQKLKNKIMEEIMFLILNLKEIHTINITLSPDNIFGEYFKTITFKLKIKR